MAMRRIAGSDLQHLDGEQWSRVQRSLNQRFAEFDDGNILSIGFGAKRCGQDARRGVLAARFHVRHKWQASRRAWKSRDPVPHKVEVRLKQEDGSFALVVLDTDVVQADSLVATGEYIDHQGMHLATTGMPVSIPGQAAELKRWGFVTVSHPFQQVSGSLAVTVDERGRGYRPVPGRLGVRSRLPSSHFDAAFIESEQQAMEAGGVFADDGVLPLTLTESQLVSVAAGDEQGLILRPEKGPARVTITDFFPIKDFEHPVFGSLRAVLRGEAEQRGVFFVGCSGSTWRVRNRLAGIQFAASEDLRVGYAQAAFAVAFEWLKQQFGQTPEIHRAF